MGRYQVEQNDPGFLIKISRMRQIHQRNSEQDLVALLHLFILIKANLLICKIGHHFIKSCSGDLYHSILFHRFHNFDDQRRKIVVIEPFGVDLVVDLLEVLVLLLFGDDL